MKGVTELSRLFLQLLKDEQLHPVDIERAEVCVNLEGQPRLFLQLNSGSKWEVVVLKVPVQVERFDGPEERYLPYDQRE